MIDTIIGLAPIIAALVGLAGTIWQGRAARTARFAAEVAAAIGLVEKYLSGQPEAVLETEALALIRTRFPAVPESIIRAAIREACRRRKLRAAGEGLRP